MQKVAEDIPWHDQHTIDLLIMPKYHCKLVGEGIKYSWGFFKTAEKKGCDCCRSCVKRVLKKVIEHMQWFSTCTDHYMLAFMLLESSESLEGHGLLYHEIEQYVNKNKGPLQHHQSRNCLIAQVWQ